MKIASVSFFPLISQSGGAQTPALAFKEWCKILNVECDSVGISNIIRNTNEYNREFDFIMLYDVFKEMNLYDFLNSYDAIFFQTPANFIQFDVEKIKVPFVVMVHDENDLNKYKTFLDFVFNRMCIGLAHIDPYDIFYSKYHKNRFMWHPCTYPKYLFNRGEYIKANPNFGGALYAGRVVDWKNPVQFCNLVNSNPFVLQDSYMFGSASDNFQEQIVLNNIGSIIWRNEPFKSMDSILNNGNYSLFWSVNGNSRRQNIIKRLDLTAFEVLKYGTMPIVNPKSIPDSLNGIFMEIDMSKRVFNSDIERKLYGYFCNYELHWDKLCDVITNSYCSYHSVMSSVSKIIDALLSKKITV